MNEYEFNSLEEVLNCENIEGITRDQYVKIMSGDDEGELNEDTVKFLIIRYRWRNGFYKSNSSDPFDV